MNSIRKILTKTAAFGLAAGMTIPGTVYADEPAAASVPAESQSEAQESPPEELMQAAKAASPDVYEASETAKEETPPNAESSSEAASPAELSESTAESAASENSTPESAQSGPEQSESVPESTTEPAPESTSGNTDPVQENTEETPAEEPEVVSPPSIHAGTGSRVITDPVVVEDHHFWQIGKKKLFTKSPIHVYEEKSEDAKVVGETRIYDLLYEIKDDDDGWLYVESGDARGFVKADDVYSGNEADEIADKILTAARADTDEKKASYDWSPRFAEATVPASENEAYAWYRATTKQVMIDKEYAIPNELVSSALNIREGPSTDYDSVATIPKNGFAYVILDDGSQWIYVESGNARGFVNRKYLDEGEDVTETVEENGEDAYDDTHVTIDPEDNDAYYYTITSVETGVPDGQIGESVVEYASNYIGNPYVWGGTSLTDGADCSGFVQSVYAQYGIDLPRVSAAQAEVGTAVPIEDAMPGDLVFYANASGVYHVMIYAGDGETVEAHSSEKGIIRGTYNYDLGLDYAVRVLDQSETPKVQNTDGAAEITPTETCGGVYTYEKWNTNWSSGTRQKALHDQYENYDDEGFGKIGDRYVIACTTTFGTVGDLIDFELEDGTVIKTVMGDAKSQHDEGCNLYGHKNGQNVIEFIVNGDTWYGTGHSNPGTSSCHPEWGGLHVTRAINYGNILG